MSDRLTFMMGEFEANFPTDRHYAKNHMWAQSIDGSTGGGRFRFGFAAYAVRLLQDVYFLDWHVEQGTTLSPGQEIGEIESSKAESSLYAPIAGQLVTINTRLLKDPSAINVDKYGAGWIFEMEAEMGGRGSRRATHGREGEAPTEPHAPASRGMAPGDLLTPDEYIEHLDAVWAVTQRTIKGQLNE